MQCGDIGESSGNHLTDIKSILHSYTNQSIDFTANWVTGFSMNVALVWYG